MSKFHILAGNTIEPQKVTQMRRKSKIKVLKRKAYGYRDNKFFELKLLSLHDPIYAFAG